MTDRESLLQAILDNPADDTVKFVYADYLEEYGEGDDLAHARLIRLNKDPHVIQFTPTGIFQPGEFRDAGSQRMAIQIARDVRRLLTGKRVEVTLRRGFVESVSVTLRDWWDLRSQGVRPDYPPLRVDLQDCHPAREGSASRVSYYRARPEFTQGHILRVRDLLPLRLYDLLQGYEREQTSSALHYKVFANEKTAHDSLSRAALAWMLEVSP